MTMLVRYRWNGGLIRLTSLDAACTIHDLFRQVASLEHGADDAEVDAGEWLTVVKTPLDAYESSQKRNERITLGTLPDHTIIEFLHTPAPPSSQPLCRIM